MGTLENSSGLVPVPLVISAGATGIYGPNSWAFDRATPVTGTDLVTCHGTFGFQFSLAYTVAPSAVTAQLQGSLDGLNWYNLGTALSATTAGVQYTAVTDTPARYVRLNLSITGGTAVQATAWVGVSE